MNQVSIFFCFAFTTEDDINVNTSCPNEAPQKWKYTMHVVLNAGERGARHVCVDLLSKW